MNRTQNKENAAPGFGRRLIRILLSFLRHCLRIVAVLAVTALLLVVLVLGTVFVISKGNSPAVRSIFVHTVKETSAIGFLADLFLSPEEVDAIINAPKEELTEETDASLVEIVHTQTADEAEGPRADAWGYVDEDGDGLILVPIKGKFTGYMLIVLDPSRVVLGCCPETLGSKGYSVQEYVEMADAVAGINAGGYPDEGGKGNGSWPDTLIVHEGQQYCGGNGVGYGFVGIDDNYVLHVGVSSSQAVTDLHIQEGCGYKPGPVLVVNGRMAPEQNLQSGLNPRSAIGQRSDGAILLLVIEGRQPSCLGASYLDLAELMLRFGAVNACNLDGGSSSLMWFNGEYINNSASVIGIRDIPTSWIVLKEGKSGNG